LEKNKQNEERCYYCGSMDKYLFDVRKFPIEVDKGKAICTDCISKYVEKYGEPQSFEHKKIISRTSESIDTEIEDFFERKIKGRPFRVK